MNYTKIAVVNEMPSEDGKYIVFTITPFKNKNVFECTFTANAKGEKKWGCHNQKVTHWLKKI